MKFIDHWLKRLRVFSDLSAWFLIAPALLTLLWIDPPMAKTLLQWSMFGVVISGVAVIISRIVFPDLHLGDFLKKALGKDGEAGDVGAAVVSASIILFVGVVFIGLVLWAKP